MNKNCDSCNSCESCYFCNSCENLVNGFHCTNLKLKEEAEKIIEEFNLDESEDWIDFFNKPEIKDIRKMYKGKPEFHVQVLKDFRNMNS